MANNYKLITLLADSKDVAEKLAEALVKIPATGSGPVVLDISTYERKVKPTDSAVAPFSKFVTMVLATPLAISHAQMLGTFAGAEVVFCDAPDAAFRTSVVMTDAARALLTFSEEKAAEPSENTGSVNAAAPKSKQNAA